MAANFSLCRGAVCESPRPSDIVSAHSSLRADFLNLIPPLLKSIRGEELVAAHLGRRKAYSNILAIGKAADSMMAGALKRNPAARALVITKYGHRERWLGRFPNLRIIESGHPVPDQNSIRAGEAIRDFCAQLGHESVLCLISGGASALAELPNPGCSLADIQTLNQRLLARKIPIAEINQERKRLSRLKGGGLAALLRQNRILALYLSDVADNATATIGSGLLKDPHSPHPDMREYILGDNRLARITAAVLAKKTSKVLCHRYLLKTAVEEVAEKLTSQLRQRPGLLHIWGGEPLVQLPAQPGQGGRNQHLALLMAAKIAGDADACFLSLGTDGTDGDTPYAGGVVTNRSYERLKRLNYTELITRAESSRGLKAMDGVIRTGPTGTNLMDLMLGYRANS